MDSQASLCASSDIQALLSQVSAAGSALIHPAGDSAEGPARQCLIAAAQKLIQGVQDPMEAMMEASLQNHRNAVIQTCFDLGIFELVPQTGTVSLQELVDETGADQQLIFRFMRMLAATGIFTEEEGGLYSHNALSLVCTGPAKHILNLIYAELSTASYKLPEYLRSTSYGTRPNPDSFSDPFQFALKTKLAVFSWLSTHPDRLTNFNLAMKASSPRAIRAISSYPFDVELAASDNENEVLLVDVGGGRGHLVEAIRAKFPKLRGKMIVQDLRETIEEIEHPKGFEPMAHDFFEPQPIKGAHIYFFSRTLHDWSDTDCHRILQHTVSAMNPSCSRILISDRVLPDTGVPPLSALLDINMMMIGGLERSRGQWANLLGGVGLEVVRVWGETEVLEARLKG